MSSSIALTVIVVIAAVLAGYGVLVPYRLRRKEGRALRDANRGESEGMTFDAFNFWVESKLRPAAASESVALWAAFAGILLGSAASLMGVWKESWWHM